MYDDKETKRLLDEVERAKIQDRFRQKAPEGLRHTPAKVQPGIFEEIRTLRVGIYARVSTNSRQQLSSLEIQQNYYEDMVKMHDNWQLVKIYADPGLSGTSTKHRKAFNEMIDDARAGKLDLIVCKMVSRFSRNILDGIGYVRELSRLNPPVGVFFENEGIYSLSNDSEMALEIHNMLSQEESRTKSTSMTGSIKMRFSRGIFLTPELIGYDLDENHNLVINEEEATTVKLIFFMYLYGYSTEMIAETLTSLQRPTKLGRFKWSASTVHGVLSNERHCGSIKAWKTYTPSFFDHKSRKNRGERDTWDIDNHHDAIVSRDDFLAAQQMLANAKYGSEHYLPKLNVTRGGALDGFVTINPRWGAFSAEDYRNASGFTERS
jgi:DNA invertase Pin-like site-specific DNA recombinase